ncbi:protein-glutamate O-methyltransferase CheR [Neorhizobium sp. T786]|uniref:CheR family methyltransferase n=1 Tax=Pseudorhizobium xiangyangii TaxID=2883104 RepID=UPI001CFF83A4|nr:protein-glutamate O-methyltransferase CheR [Neorhizobium xiangyangii]MCB5203813.1 protein-glutamate O-methyltransferase CheR [Neorhizobium xiangyangii]
MVIAPGISAGFISAPLSQADLEEICAIIYERSGMVFGETKRYYIERRVTDLINQRRAQSVRNYISMLRGDQRETELLINSFTVNETYFYREQHQLACLSGSILPDIIRSKGPGDRIRIWSMPCSSGEEPYSIAIWLLENWPLVDAYNIDITGSDIDTDILKQAVEGLFGQRSLSKLPEDVRERYFEPEKDQQRRLISDLRESVTFASGNIVERESLTALGRFDVIFCRNLLIYFDQAAREAAARHIHDLLHPGGYICLGHTESMSRISETFEPVRFPEAIVYRDVGRK